MSAERAHLVLVDGAVFSGVGFGATGDACGEAVFNTSMTGYQEMLTDPSYAGQILVLTYPLIGNYGVNRNDIESRRIQVQGLVVREYSSTPSHWPMEATLSDYLREAVIPAIAGIDTRALTRRLRTRGVMMGIITPRAPQEARELLAALPAYDDQDYVRSVSVESPYEEASEGRERFHIAVIDVGLKYNIQRHLRRRGCRITVLPATTAPQDVLSLAADGVVVSPGPGDPQRLDYVVETVKGLVGRLPVMGICLGHQAVARAFGADTYKLKFGHRGANHPVVDRSTGRVHITSQNHGYAVDPSGLPADLAVTQVHLNDGTVEGMAHRREPLLTIQYHSEASPGPHDNAHLFDRFLDLVAAVKGRRDG